MAAHGSLTTIKALHSSPALEELKKHNLDLNLVLFTWIIHVSVLQEEGKIAIREVKFSRTFGNVALDIIPCGSRKLPSSVAPLATNIFFGASRCGEGPPCQNSWLYLNMFISACYPSFRIIYLDDRLTLFKVHKHTHLHLAYVYSPSAIYQQQYVDDISISIFT